MKKKPLVRAFVLATCWLCKLAFSKEYQAQAADAAKPANYAEIKALLGSYVSAIDNYGEAQDGRAALLAKGDEATEALIELLKEKISAQGFPQEKSAIVSILALNKATDKKRSARLLARILPKDVEEWKGQWWIVQTLRFLVQVDSETALQVARKAMKGSVSEVTVAAMKALGAVGDLEDVRTLDLFRAGWRADLEKAGGSPYKEYDAVDDEAVQAEAAIYKRIGPHPSS